MFGQSILVLIPHPDDEVVGAALAIRRARACGATIWGLDLTNGCPPTEALWPWSRRHYAARVARRRDEAASAARALGLVRITDDGLPARHLRLALAAQYARALAAVETHAIDTVWAPAYEGAHADHDCANALAAALVRARPTLAAWEFAEYNNAGGRLRRNAFPDGSGRECGEIEIGIEDDSEGRWKAQMLAIYGSERFNLANVTRGNENFRERFRPLPAHDYARPPHAGRLFYERFHWVPLRVPAIDFTPPAAVSAAITAFLGTVAA